MSNFLAIATVTAALSDLLSEALLDFSVHLGGASVTTLRPDVGTGLPAPGVNVFLYQVTPNAALRNADLPTRRANGEVINRSQAALELHYLLSCYGDDAELEPQRVLGVVVRALHTQPVLTRELIRKSVINGKFKNHITQSNLADALDLVRFTPLSLSLEELSKLWSVYFQTHYSLSVAYQASVVLIESEDVTHAALPVRERNIVVQPFRQPLIEAVNAKDRAGEFIFFDSSVVVNGQRLRGETTQVVVSGVDATSGIELVSDTQIVLKLPSGLGAGVQGLQVVQPISIGTPPTEHRGVESNLIAFVLHPLIQKKPDGSAEIVLASSELTVKVNPAVTPAQRVSLLLNELSAPADPVARSYSLDATPLTAESNELVFPVSGVAPGTYLVRVQVDGAESALELDPDVTKLPRYMAPQVTI
jgi:hypothetical protein